MFQLVQEAIPQAYDETNSSISATAIAVHILNFLFKKLTEVFLVQGGEVCHCFPLLDTFAEFFVL